MGDLSVSKNIDSDIQVNELKSNFDWVKMGKGLMTGGTWNLLDAKEKRKANELKKAQALALAEKQKAEKESAEAEAALKKAREDLLKNENTLLSGRSSDVKGISNVGIYFGVATLLLVGVVSTIWVFKNK